MPKWTRRLSPRPQPRQLARFPGLAGPAVETDDPFGDEWLMPLSDVFPERLEATADSGLERMAHLVQRVPSYWPELCRDVSAIPAPVDKPLAEAMSS